MQKLTLVLLFLNLQNVLVDVSALRISGANMDVKAAPKADNEAEAYSRSNPFRGYENGDPQNCPQSTLTIAEVLPGGGWDNLRNIPMGPVIAYNYSKCKIFQDRSFILPDNVYAVALKSSNVESFSELMTHFSNFTSVTSNSINVGAGASFHSWKISASFSRGYKDTKKHIAGSRSTASRIQLRYEIYKLKSEPDAQLHLAFKNRLFDIAACVQNGDNDTATYLAQLLVRDYGSHYVTSITAGAGLVKTDYLNSSYINSMNSDVTTIKAAASLSFSSIFGIHSKYTHSVSDIEINKYTRSTIDSKTISYGGPPIKANFSLDNWVDDIGNNLVALDRDGDPLYYVITPRTLPELPMDTVQDVADVVQDAVESFYKHNLYQGCTNIDAPNFSYMANFDDNSCHAASNNYSFGGVYQTCSGYNCKQTQINPKTGKYSCPQGYLDVLLQHGTVVYTPSPVTTCHQVCKRHWLKKNCWDECSTTQPASEYTYYEIYWCAATGKVESNSGYLFGGAFTSKTENPLVQSKDCPPFYTTLKVGWNDKMFICVSDDYELGFRYSVKFAGLYSCSSGNPIAIFMNTTESLIKLMSVPRAQNEGMSLSAYRYQAGSRTWPKKCPPGYSQHLWLINDGCEINYCVVMNALTPWALPEISLPPYHDKPKLSAPGSQMKILVSAKNNFMLKDRESGEWKTTTGEDQKSTNLQSDNTSTSSSADSVTITVLAVISGVALLTILIFATVKIVQKVRRPKPYRVGLMAEDDGQPNPSYNTFEESEA